MPLKEIFAPGKVGGQIQARAKVDEEERISTGKFEERYQGR